jgi:hypothetical protein
MANAGGPARQRPPLHKEALAVDSQRSRQSGILQTRLGMKACQQLVGNSRPSLRRRILTLGKRNLAFYDVFRIEARIDRRDWHQAAQEEAVRNQKHHGQRNLRDRQDTPHILAAAIASQYACRSLMLVCKLGILSYVVRFVFPVDLSASILPVLQSTPPSNSNQSHNLARSARL